MNTFRTGLGALVVGASLMLPLGSEGGAIQSNEALFASSEFYSFPASGNESPPTEAQSAATDALRRQYLQNLELLTEFYQAKVKEGTMNEGDKLRVLTPEGYTQYQSFRMEYETLAATRTRSQQKLDAIMVERKPLEEEYRRKLRQLQQQSPQEDSLRSEIKSLDAKLERLGTDFIQEVSSLVMTYRQYEHLSAKSDVLPTLATLQMKDGKLRIMDYPQQEFRTHLSIAQKLVEVLSQRYLGQYGFPAK